MMAEKQTPKARFSTKLPNGDFLGITIWPGKSEPSAEVVTVQIRHTQPATTGRQRPELRSIAHQMAGIPYFRKGR